jgi:hypothetical protein
MAQTPSTLAQSTYFTNEVIMAGTVVADTLQSSITGTPPQFNDGVGTQIGTLCRAFVNFNGTGTVAIRASFNVSSITDNGTGDYTVNFTTAMPDANYTITGASMISITSLSWFFGPYTSTSASSARIFTLNSSLVLVDSAYVQVAIFR